MADDDVKPRPDPTTLTTDALLREVKIVREYYDAILKERDTQYQMQFQSSKDAVEAAFLASEKAIGKAEISIEKRADATYVALAELQKMLGGLMPRSESESRYNDQEKRVNELGTRVERIESFKSGGKEQLVGIYSMVGFIISLFVLGGILAASGVFSK